VVAWDIVGFLDRFRRRPDGGLPSPEVAALCERLRHPDWQERAAAAQALGELGGGAEAAVPALEEAISDDHGDVCLAASAALSRIRSASH